MNEVQEALVELAYLLLGAVALLGVIVLAPIALGAWVLVKAIERAGG